LIYKDINHGLAQARTGRPTSAWSQSNRPKP